MKTAVKVPVWEHERGWGSKIDDYMVCLSVADAHKFAEEFNAKNTEEKVPDWYMRAEVATYPIDLEDKQYNKIKSQKNKRMWLSGLK